MGWPDSPPSNMRCCGGDKKDSRPLVPGPQLPGKLHAALASHTDVQTEQVEPRPLPHRGFQILRAGKGPPLVLHVPSPQDILLYGADSSLHGCRKSPQHTAGRCRGEIVPVKWVKNSVKVTATPDYPNAIYICNTSGQTYSLVTILEVDE